MSSILIDALAHLTKPAAAAEIQALVERLAAAERQDDPPFRYYLIARPNGVSLLFEDDRLIDVQVFVEPTKKFSSCPLDLPFGLRRGMNQAEVHGTLGVPETSDETDSRYVLAAHSARLLAAYNDVGLLTYLSFAPQGCS
jgi:hypothetical protein